MGVSNEDSLAARYAAIKLQTSAMAFIVYKSKKNVKPYEILPCICIPFFITLLLHFLVAITFIGSGLANYGTVLLPTLDNGPTGVFNLSLSGSNHLLIAADPIIYYSPASHKAVNSLMQGLQTKFPFIQAIGCIDVNDAISKAQTKFQRTLASVEFDLTPEQSSSGLLVTSISTPVNVSYTIRMNQAVVNEFMELSNDVTASKFFSSSTESWWSSGYLTIKNYIDTNLANSYPFVKASNFTIQPSFQRYVQNFLEDYPPADTISNRYNFLPIGAPILVSIILFYPQLSIAAQTVRDTETKMRDLLEITGLSSLAYYLSIYIVTWAFTLFIEILMMMVLGLICFGPVQVGAYFGLILCYGPSLMSFSLAAGHLIPRSEFFSLPVLFIICILAIAGSFIAADASVSIGGKAILSLIFPPMAFANGVWGIESFVYNTPTAAFVDIAYYNTKLNIPSVGLSTFLMFLGSFMWLLVAVFNRELVEHGKQLIRFVTTGSIALPVVVGGSQDTSHHMKAKCVYEESMLTNASDGRTLLECKNVSKTFDDGTRAVVSVSFSVKEGNILSFLGSNGAGKSTTISMLCGVLSVTSGDGIINGHSIITDRVQARQSLGVCFQQDVYWSNISVEDHLTMFAQLRGSSGVELTECVEAMLVSLGFPEKRRTWAGDLSGGQRRRLCVGLSMIGAKAKVAFLDEPTAALDPVARRQVWKMIERNRAGRAIILTTHYLDEADILGDSVAVIKSGQLIAYGTSSFLKRQFGLGYLCRMSMSPDAVNDRILQLTLQIIPAASVSSAAGTELAIRLPSAAAEQFSQLFQQYELRGHELGIVSFGIEPTSLEEVFMKIITENTESVEEENIEEQIALFTTKGQRYILPVQSDHTTPSEKSHELTFMELKEQVQLMLNKRYFQFIRSKGQCIFGVILPIIFAIGTALILSSFPRNVFNTSIPVGTVISSPAAPYTPAGATLVAAQTSSMAADYATAFGINPIIYAGVNYSSIYQGVSGGNQMSEGVYFQKFSKFRMAYNNQQSLNFGALATLLIEGTAAAATDNLLTITSSLAQFPTFYGFTEVAQCFLVGFFIALYGGSVGGSIALVLGDENIRQVKHQQLACGASIKAYWIANFIFDFVVISLQNLVFTIILVAICPSFQGVGFFTAIVGGILFALAGAPRFHVLAMLVKDMKMVQTMFFFGSLLLMMFWNALMYDSLMIIPIQSAATGGLKYFFSLQGASYIGLCIFSIIFDPVYGFLLLLIYQSNFLAALSYGINGLSLSALDPMICGPTVLGMLIAALLYLIGLKQIEFHPQFLQNVQKSFLNGCCSCFMAKASHKAHLQILPCPVVIGIASATFVEKPNTQDENTSAKPIKPAKPVVRLVTKSQPSGIDIGGHNPMIVTVNATAISSPGKDLGTGTGAAIDDDVMVEKNSVQEIFQSGKLYLQKNAVYIHNVRKVFIDMVAEKVAVSSFSLNVAAGDIFGLLGANGAGKTTLLKVVSGLEAQTEGEAYVNGFDISTETNAAQRCLGLCAQHDTLIDKMSVIENLQYFGRLKGINQDILPKVIDSFLQALDIKQYSKKLIQQLSGGTKRKISLVVALLGLPPSVYLDEPSSGLDSVACRLVWGLLTKIGRTKESAIILTTHNMTECEAVCSRIGVMKDGELTCLGDSQHLRAKHGKGYIIEMTLTKESEELANQSAIEFIQSNFRNSELLSNKANIVKLSIPKSSILLLSSAFAIIEERKLELGIVDYSLCQTSLEEVFISKIQPRVMDDDVDLDDGKIRATEADLLAAYTMWFLSLFLPGMYRFFLRDYKNGVIYFFTANLFMIGWYQDMWYLPALVEKSVALHGHLSIARFCWCCPKACCCCKCCGTRDE